MPKAIKNFVFCVHAHQPVGNFGCVFEEAYQKCYKPFFDVLQSHENFSVACHFSGSLLDWIEEHHADFIAQVKKMGDRGQIEFVGGAYYEPIYGVISREDLAGQIAMMRDKIRHFFGQTPKGAWLTERVWDPELVTPLRKASVEYTILDDTHFESARVPLPVTGYYRARRGWEALDLFASQKTLRYLLPFNSAEEALTHILSLNAGGQAVVFADDCEKFGFWPGTHDWVYGQKWLDRFLTLVENEPSIRTQTFEQFRQSHPPRATVKVPPASYSEMMQWSGGHFNNFFKKYPESNYMRERMRRVSVKLARFSEDGGRKTEERGQKTEDREQRAEDRGQQARLALYRAQCNCSYWHGVFGGLYLHHLRSTVYENLIRAESWLKEAPSLSLERFETGDRWVLRQKNIVSYFNARYGGALEELDYLPRPANLVCTLQRRPETYHSLVLREAAPPADGAEVSLHEMLGSKENNLQESLQYDPFRRLCFLDHFFEKELSRAEFHESRYEDRADFTASEYRARREGSGVCFERMGILRLGEKYRLLRLQKRVTAEGDSRLQVRYTFHNPGETPLSFVFAPEFNFSIGAPEAAEAIEVAAVKRWVFKDNWRGIEVRLDSQAPCRLIATPVETVSGSESGLERTYQQLAVLFQKALTVPAGEFETMTFGLEAGDRGP